MTLFSTKQHFLCNNKKSFGGLKMQTLKCKSLKTFEMAICGNGDIMSLLCSVKGCFSICVLQRSCVLVFSFYVIINRRSSVPFLKNASTEDAWKCLDVFLKSRMRRVQTWEKSQKTLRAAGVRKPVSFKLTLANTWRLLKLKVNIYRFVLLNININKVIRPGESLHFYWHIKINLNS